MDVQFIESLQSHFCVSHRFLTVFSIPLTKHESKLHNDMNTLDRGFET
jgi:hypothetical protein